MSIITAKELAQKIVKNERIFILDVRNKEEFDNWKIEGEKSKYNQRTVF